MFSPINLSINFRICDNDEKTLNELQNLSKNMMTIAQHNEILEHKIYYENDAPFILLNTNLCERPIKLILDTGAAITVIAQDLIADNIEKINYIVNLFGLAGKEHSIKTLGLVHCSIMFGGHPLSACFHLVDRKFSGSADGYLGFSFLAPYKAVIDMNKKCIKINLNELSNTQKMENENNNEIKQVTNLIHPSGENNNNELDKDKKEMKNEKTIDDLEKEKRTF